MKVSIIIPVYNVEPYIEECLQSVTNQTMTEGVECIIVDDCGTDRSMQVVERFVEAYQGPIPFRIFHHDQNKGLSAARNTGIRSARGDFLFFLDSDDYILPECLELLYSYTKQYPNVELVQGSSYDDTTDVNQVNSSFPFNFSTNQRIIKRFLLTFNGKVAAQHRLVSRGLIIGSKLFFKEGIIHEDLHWTFFLSKHVKNFAFCGKRVYYYRKRPGSITQNINKSREATSFKLIIEDLTSHIDCFLSGRQKEFILEILMHVLRSKYYASEEELLCLINNFAKINSPFEKLLFKLCWANGNKLWNSKILHLLIRIYKYEDRYDPN